MQKLVLMFALFSAAATAGDLPDKLYFCRVEGELNGRPISIVSGGEVNGVQASDDALYECNWELKADRCQIVECWSEPVTPVEN